jgi:hypothetical protein
VVSVVTRLQVEDLRNCGLIRDRARNFSGLKVQTGSGTHLSSLSMGMGGSVGGGGVK